MASRSRQQPFRTLPLDLSKRAQPSGPLIVGRAIYFDHLAGQAEYPWVIALPAGAPVVALADASAYRHYELPDGSRLLVGRPKVTAIRAVHHCLATWRQLRTP